MALTPIKFRFLTPFIAIVLATTVAACGTPLDRDAARSIRTIALIPADDPNVGINPVNNIAGVPGYMGGAVGFLLAPGGGGEQSKAVNSQMNESGLRIGTEFTSHVENALKKNGYTVIRLEAVHRDNSGKLIDNYDKIDVDADAILDINVPVAGYYDKPFSPYYPTLVLAARLVDRKSKRELFSNMFSYGGTTSLYPDKVIEADSKYSFWHRDDIAKSPSKTIEAFRVGIAGLTELLRRQLVK